MCKRKSSSSLGGGVSPNTSSLPRARGAGLVCSVAAAAAAPAPGLSGGGSLLAALAAAPRARGPGEIRPGMPPGWRKRRVELEARGTDFFPSSGPLQLAGASTERLRGGRGLRLWPGSGSPRARRAQRDNRRALAALRNLRRHCRSLSLPFHPGANRKRAA